MRLLSRKNIKNIKDEQKRREIIEAKKIIELLKEEKQALGEFREFKFQEMTEIRESYSQKMAQLEDKRAKLSNEVEQLGSDKKKALRIIEKAKLILEELNTCKI